jgi:solute:Na+ symporter, SSS family
MHWIDWVIFGVPLLFVLGLALYARKYVRGIVDFLAAGRVAGRYIISVGDMQASLAIITLIALCEAEYQAGMAMRFWNNLLIPVTIFISLTGYCIYRFRQTKCLSIGQFLELRYNRPLRIIAAAIRTIAEMMVNSIGPAVAARFFIYLLGFPLTVSLLGFEVSTYALTMIVLLSMALLIIWPGGRISLLLTDAIQGLISYPVFVIFTVFVLTEISWTQDVAPIMLDRVPGESFLNPMDLSSLRNFNIFSLIVLLTHTVLNYGAWFGGNSTSSGRNAHEQKMAGILGAWRNGFAMLMMALMSIFIVTVMLSNRHSEDAREVRADLIAKVTSETVADQQIRARIIKDVNSIPAAKHIIGVDKPYSQKLNPDTAYLEATHKNLKGTPDGNTIFQKTKTLYYQMMAPSVFRKKIPTGIMGLLVLLMVMLLLSTDDSRIFNSATTLVQDVIMPFRKKPFKPREHLMWLRIVSVLVCLFFLIVSLFFAQIDFILMFLSIMSAVWLGAAGPIMLGGLYTRLGTTTGAFCALIFGTGSAFSGIILQSTWSGYVYPWLAGNGGIKYVNAMFDGVTSLCSPLVVWEMSAVKFPVNSYEIFFIAMISGVAAYIIGSLVTYRKPFNLDRMLHRGKYNNGESNDVKTAWTWRSVWGKLIGIDGEYTTGDKVIAWSVFGYAVVYQLFIAFFGVLIWNMFSPWPAEWWSSYFFITIVVVGVIAGAVSTVWFMIGGIVDIRRLFKDLAARVDNPLDDGWVEDHVSLVDLKTSSPDKNDKQSES